MRILLIIMALIIILCFIQPAEATLYNVTINATADSFVESLNPTVNYGSDGSLTIENHVTFKHSRAYLTFPTTVEPAFITNATLGLLGDVGSGSGTVTTYAREVLADFNESNITWNAQTCPASCNTTNMDTVGLGGGGAVWNYWNVSYAAQNTSRNNITLMLITPETDVEGYRYLASKENVTTTIRPKLTIFYNNEYWTNNYTNDNSASFLSPRKIIQFNYSVMSETSYNWSVNGVLQASTSNILNYNFSADGTYAIVTNAISQGETNSWTVYISGNVGNWTFNAGSGTWANDTSGFDNNGTITGAAWNSTDIVNNKSLFFDGTDSISIPDSASLDIDSAQSFTGWIKPQSITGTQRILEKLNEYGVFLVGSELQYYIWQSSGAAHSSVSGGTVINDSWIFISGTYSNNSVTNLYINNVLVDINTSFAGTTSPGTNSLVFGNRSGQTENFTGLMDEFKLYNYVLTSAELTTEYQRFHPVLTYPINGSTITSIYPPQTANVNFTWHDSEYSSDEIIISTDTNFNVIAADVFTTNDYYLATLDVDTKYYWKIKQYDSTNSTYGDTSTVHNFTISSTGGATGLAIQGVVYELIDGTITPIDEATVYAYNTTHSFSMVTGSNGYYYFNLSNGTYNVYASKVLYDTTVVFPVTVNGSIATNNILMKQTEPTDFESNQQFVMFRARWLWCFTNCDVEGLTVTIYKSGDVIAYKSGVTDSLGIFKAKLFKSQLYRVTFVNATLGVNQEGNYYGSNPEYLILITNTGTTFQEHDTQEKDAIDITVSKTTHNSTMANISINYSDSLSQTTALTYYINQSNTSDPENQTVISSWIWAAGTYNHTFNVYNYSGQSYLVHVVVTHTEYGTIDRTYAVIFEKSAGVGITNISNTLWMWFAIGIMFFTGAIFTSSTAEKGLLIVCAEGWIFLLMGMFASLGTVQFGIGLTLASVMAVLAYFKKSNVADGYT